MVHLNNAALSVELNDKSIGMGNEPNHSPSIMSKSTINIPQGPLRTISVATGSINGLKVLRWTVTAVEVSASKQKAML